MALFKADTHLTLQFIVIKKQFTKLYTNNIINYDIYHVLISFFALTL